MSASGIRLGQVDTELPTPAALADVTANPTVPLVGAGGLVFNGSTWDRVRGVGAGDLAAAGIPAAGMYGYNPSGPGWDRLRVATLFKQAVIPAGGTVNVWTPTSGKKARIMGYRIEVPGDVSVAGAQEVVIQILDAGGGTGLRHLVWIPAAAPNTAGCYYSSGPIALGNGVLSAAANNVISAATSVGLATGSIQVEVWGVEE